MDESSPELRRRLYAALFHGAWIALVLAAAWQRFSLPLAPLADNDTWGFLSPALQAILGQGFQHTMRGFLYPGMIRGLLAVFPDFRAITILQHLLGLATGVLLLAAWTSAIRCIPHPRLPGWIFDLAGLLMMATYLLASEPAHFEYLIRADAICPFFAALALYSIVRFLIARKVEASSGKTLFFGAFSMFVALLIPALKPSFWLTSVLLTIPVWMALFDRKETLARRLTMAGLPVIAAGLLIWAPEHYFAIGDQSTKRFLPESLFSIHALIIREQIADDAAHPDPSVPYSQEKLQSTLNLLDADIAESPGHFESLGYDADSLLYRQPFFLNMARAEGFDWDVVLPFYNYYYWRTWRKRPLPMLGKVANQLGLFYRMDCPAYCDKMFELERLYDRSLFALSDPAFQRVLRQWPPAVHWLEDQERLVDHAPIIDMNRALRWTINAFSRGYLPALLLFLATLPWILFNAERRARFGVICTLLAIGYAFNFGNNLGIAVLHTLEVSRYTYIQFATTIWTETLTFAFLLELLLECARHARPKTVFTQTCQIPL